MLRAVLCVRSRARIPARRRECTPVCYYSHIFYDDVRCTRVCWYEDTCLHVFACMYLTCVRIFARELEREERESESKSKSEKERERERARREAEGNGSAT